MNITHKNYPVVKQYVQIWKKVVELSKTNPDITIKVNWNMTKTALQTRQWFLDALNNRINSRGCITFPYKKQQDDYFWNLKRDQRRLQDWYSQRIIIHSFDTAECRKRFGNLIYNRE
jgi:hypothetical protein